MLPHLISAVRVQRAERIIHKEHRGFADLLLHS
jgi:hypothetical protein